MKKNLNAQKYGIYLSSHVGKVRQNNEDNFAINGFCKEQDAPIYSYTKPWDDTPVLLAVFDGIGGAANGEVAAKIAADCTMELYKQLLKQPNTEPDGLVIEYVQTANRKIGEMLSYANCGRGGCTLALAYVKDGLVYTYSIGDSRIYWLHDGKLYRISKDHTLAMKKYEDNIYTKEEAENSPDQHTLTLYLGMREQENLTPEIYFPFRMAVGDKLLLCSDGLYDMASADEITQTLNGATDPANDLVELALKNGGGDNVTCVVLQAE